jgi:hypothetical protein
LIKFTITGITENTEEKIDQGKSKAWTILRRETYKHRNLQSLVYREAVLHAAQSCPTQFFWRRHALWYLFLHLAHILIALWDFLLRAGSNKMCLQITDAPELHYKFTVNGSRKICKGHQLKGYVLPQGIHVPYFSDHRPLLFFSAKLATTYTPNAAYLLSYEVQGPKNYL